MDEMNFSRRGHVPHRQDEENAREEVALILGGGTVRTAEHHVNLAKGHEGHFRSIRVKLTVLM